MNWTEAIESIDYSSRENQYNCIDISDMANYFGICYYGWSDEIELRFKKYWITSWICTDTMVGLAVYKLDDEVVAVSSQSARKSDENIMFMSKESAMKVREFILSLTEEEDVLNIDICDLSQEIDQSWFNKK